MPALKTNRKLAMLVYYVAMIIILIFFILKSAVEVKNGAFSFDGAYNAQVAQNLSSHSEYSTTYLTNVKDHNLFSVNITCGPPLIFPVSVMFMIFGAKFGAGLAVNAVYMIFLYAALLYYLRKGLKFSRPAVLLAAILLAGFPGIFENGFGLYGDIPALFYIVMTLVMLNRFERGGGVSNIYWAGIFVGLGFMTKVTVIIVLSAVFAYFIFELIKNRGKKFFLNYSLKKFIRFFAGFATPVIFFEIYRLIHTGFYGYVEWINGAILDTLTQSGIKGGAQYPGLLFESFTSRLSKLPQTIFTSPPAVIIMILITLAFFFYILFHIFKGHDTGKEDRYLLKSDIFVLYGTTILYLIWWIFIASPEKSSFRRITDGLILLQISALASINFIYGCIRLKTGFKMTIKGIYGFIMAVLIIAASFSFFTGKNVHLTVDHPESKASLIEAGTYIKNLPANAEFFGYGWWQAPVVAFSSGRSFKNILMDKDMDAAGPKDDKYLIVDNYNYGLDFQGLQAILSKYDAKTVFANSECRIYKLISRNTYGLRQTNSGKLFSNKERETVSYSEIKFGENCSNIFVKNVYTGENNTGGKWAKKISAYLLKYSRQKILNLALYFPDISKYDVKPVSLDIFVNGTFKANCVVVKSGLENIEIPMDGIRSGAMEVTVRCNSRLVSDKDKRELAFFAININLK